MQDEPDEPACSPKNRRKNRQVGNRIHAAKKPFSKSRSRVTFVTFGTDWHQLLVRRIVRHTTAFVALTFALFAGAPAYAGPPYLTDDPAPTETGHWEIYTFGTGTQSEGAFDGVAGLDLNYGPVAGVQLTATIPVDYAHSGGQGATGFGDLELGVKYRLYNDEASGVSVAIFPRIILPTADSRNGQGKVAYLLPIWGQKDFGPWSAFGGGGYAINPGAGNRDYWTGSAALTRTLSSKLSLGGEIAHRGADAAGGKPYTALNFGGIYQLGGPFALLFSGGPGIENARDGGKYNVYLGLATNF